MIERDMEELIVAFPQDFFPRKTLVLKGRQQSFAGVGRFDILFEDEHQTQILMELKARAAKYEDATQLAKYKDALEARGVRHIVMWLVATIIPNAVREFMDRIGIEYTEIHDREYREVAARHQFTIDGEQPNPTSEMSVETQKRSSPGSAPVVRSEAEGVVRPDPRVRANFQAVLDAYAKIAARGFQLSGRAQNYRQVEVPQWPERIHYEFMDRGSTIGVELHFESREAAWPAQMIEIVGSFKPELEALFPTATIYWNPKRPLVLRLAVLFQAGTEPGTVAQAMLDLIKHTRTRITEALQAARLLD